MQKLIDSWGFLSQTQKLGHFAWIWKFKTNSSDEKNQYNERQKEWVLAPCLLGILRIKSHKDHNSPFLYVLKIMSYQIANVISSRFSLGSLTNQANQFSIFLVQWFSFPFMYKPSIGKGIDNVTQHFSSLSSQCEHVDGNNHIFFSMNCI